MKTLIDKSSKRVRKYYMDENIISFTNEIDKLI